ncbi:MAG: protein-L-isoaspartate(D-aspartate) O-methyltransferase, partial [Pirellulaceae bacterium]
MIVLNQTRNLPTPFLPRETVARILLLLLVLVSTAPCLAQQASYEQLRMRMVKEAIVDAGVKNPRVIQSMQTTKRHEFVSSRLRKQAYFDMALPIGDQQTISSPFIVAYM